MELFFYNDNLTDSEVDNIRTRVGIIDRLVNTEGDKAKELLEKGLKMEQNLKAQNPNYTSQLTEKVAEFRRLNASYNH